MGNYLSAAIGAFLTALVALALHTLDVAAITARSAAQLKSQEGALVAQCNTQKQTTSEVDNAVQKSNNLTAGNYNAAVQLLLNQSSQPAIANATSKHNATAFDNGLYYADVRAAIAVTNRQRIATEQATEMIGCQKFIADERKGS